VSMVISRTEGAVWPAFCPELAQPAEVKASAIKTGIRVMCIVRLANRILEE
jgi:hypothetical protein